MMLKTIEMISGPAWDRSKWTSEKKEKKWTSVIFHAIWIDAACTVQ